MCEDQAKFTELEEWPRVCMTAVFYVAPMLTASCFPDRSFFTYNSIVHWRNAQNSSYNDDYTQHDLHHIKPVI